MRSITLLAYKPVDENFEEVCLTNNPECFPCIPVSCDCTVSKVVTFNSDVGHTEINRKTFNRST